MPLPHVKQSQGGQVFPNIEIDTIRDREARSLRRFDVDCDLPGHFTPEFPPPIYLTTHTELGDVSKGNLLAIKNYYALMVGILHAGAAGRPAPAADAVPPGGIQPDRGPQIGGPEPWRDVSRLPCQFSHQCGVSSNAGHPPAGRPVSPGFHQPEGNVQPVHGSKRSLRSVEDFTQFEHRTAYFNGDHASAQRKGANLPNRTEQVAMMAQMQGHHRFSPGAETRSERTS
jgi:hypothetical protein